MYFSLVLQNVFQPGVTKCISAWCYKMYFSLVLQENMEEMVKLITEEPTDETEEKLKYK